MKTSAGMEVFPRHGLTALLAVLPPVETVRRVTEDWL
jgi:hypothetical protein